LTHTVSRDRTGLHGWPGVRVIRLGRVFILICVMVLRILWVYVTYKPLLHLGRYVQIMHTRLLRMYSKQIEQVLEIQKKHLYRWSCWDHM